MFSKRMVLSVAVVLLLVNSICLADDKEIHSGLNRATKALAETAEKVTNKIQNLAKQDFNSQIQDALKEMKEGKGEIKYQKKVVGLMLQQTRYLLDSHRDTKGSNLQMRCDAVIKSYQILIDLTKKKSEKYKDLAKNSTGYYKKWLEELSTASYKISKSYENDIQFYQGLKISDKMIEIQQGIEYLQCVEEFLQDLNNALETASKNVEAMEMIGGMMDSINKLQKSIKDFSDIQLTKAIERCTKSDNIEKYNKKDTKVKKSK